MGILKLKRIGKRKDSLHPKIRHLKQCNMQNQVHNHMHIHTYIYPEENEESFKCFKSGIRILNIKIRWDTFSTSQLLLYLAAQNLPSPKWKEGHKWVWSWIITPVF